MEIPVVSRPGVARYQRLAWDESFRLLSGVMMSSNTKSGGTSPDSLYLSFYPIDLLLFGALIT